MSSTNTTHQGRNPWKKLLQNIKISGRMRDSHCKKEPREIDITWEQLRDTFIDQEAKCYWFKMILNPDDIFERFNPLAISADRINDNQGYVYSNVVICSRMANLGRGKCESDKFRCICEYLKKSMYNQQHIEYNEKNIEYGTTSTVIISNGKF